VVVKREMATANRKTKALLSIEFRLSAPVQGGILLSMTLDDEKAKNLKIQWKKLWDERLVDRQRAEGIATCSYSELFIEQGTVLHATRDFKTLSLKEIITQHGLGLKEYPQPEPSIGGYGVFIKKWIGGDKKPKAVKKGQKTPCQVDNTKKMKQQFKKSGKGWLNIVR
jgi:hypothetical protein